MKAQNNSTFVRFALHILALSLCILPPALATLYYFPLWQVRGGFALLSGGAVLLLTLSAIPLMKLITAKIRSAASYVMWSIIFIIFFLLREIADEMTVISFFGAVGNLAGALIFKIAKGGDDDG